MEMSIRRQEMVERDRERLHNLIKDCERTTSG